MATTATAEATASGVSSSTGMSTPAEIPRLRDVFGDGTDGAV